MIKGTTLSFALALLVAGGCGNSTEHLLETGSINAAPVSTLGSPDILPGGDKAPKGTFEAATKGALNDRDYHATQLAPQKALSAINEYRNSKGLGALKLDAQLNETALRHCRDLAKWDRISHYGSDGTNPWDRVKASGYQPRLAAENVGTGQTAFAEVLRGWKESPGHNKNLLLSDAKDVGIALVVDPKTEFKSFWTLVVGAKL
jgi:uncharacterized protein YkwD